MDYSSRVRKFKKMATDRQKRFQLAIKRALDVVISVLILALLSPLILLITVAIKFETGGPVFVVTRENCYSRQNIPVLRFQTGGYVSVTRLLTESGFDQVPMLLNVLRGDMSIVGPRCQIDVPPSLVPRVELDPLYESSLKPGLISLEIPDEAAVAGLGQVEADTYYVSHWSLWLDVKILFVYLFSKAAYV